jgi:cell division initiation protein
MKLTPIDIVQQSFARRWRGVDRREVSAFLELVAGQFEELIKENRSLRDEMRLMERELATFHEREVALKETMITAQRVTEDLREQAKKEAELIVGEA